MIRFLLTVGAIGLLAYGLYKVNDETASATIAPGRPLVTTESGSPTESDLAAIKKTVDRAAALQNAIAGAAAIVATACVAVKQSACGAVASGISGATWLGSAVTAQASLDLTDENYPKFASADGRHVDISKLPTSTQAIVRTLIRANNIKTTINSTANEALAAAEAGNIELSRKTLGTLRQYEDQISQISTELTAELAAYVPNIPSPDKVSSAMAGIQLEASALTYQLRATTEDVKARALFSCLWTSDGAVGYAQKAFCKSMNFFTK